MSISEPIRIISDLHCGHSSSAFSDVEQIAPLLKGPRTLVFNGDSVEIHRHKYREAGYRNADALRELCRNAGVEPYLINGNHDPNITDLDHLDLADGSVLVTHGDLLFYNISPWHKQLSTAWAKAHTEALETMGDEAFHDFEKRLHASKKAVLAVEIHDVPLPRGPLAKIAFLIEELWPPWRPLQIIKCWMETPGRAVALARVFRPRARFIIVGHTHHAGIWKIGPRVVINTGSFMPLAKRFLVDIEGNVLTVKRIEFDGKQFQTGRQIARFNTTKLKAHEGY